jgi:hypothetical protein
MDTHSAGTHNSMDGLVQYSRTQGKKGPRHIINKVLSFPIDIACVGMYGALCILIVARAVMYPPK